MGYGWRPPKNLMPKMLFTNNGFTFIVAAHNFAGGGKSIEHVVAGLMGAGIKAVFADSFSRLQFRNAINYGLPFITSRKHSSKLCNKMMCLNTIPKQES